MILKTSIGETMVISQHLSKINKTAVQAGLNRSLLLQKPTSPCSTTIITLLLSYLYNNWLIALKTRTFAEVLVDATDLLTM